MGQKNNCCFCTAWRMKPRWAALEGFTPTHVLLATPALPTRDPSLEAWFQSVEWSRPGLHTVTQAIIHQNLSRCKELVPLSAGAPRRTLTSSRPDVAKNSSPGPLQRLSRPCSQGTLLVQLTLKEILAAESGLSRARLSLLRQKAHFLGINSCFCLIGLSFSPFSFIYCFLFAVVPFPRSWSGRATSTTVTAPPRHVTSSQQHGGRRLLCASGHKAFWWRNTRFLSHQPQEYQALKQLEKRLTPVPGLTNVIFMPSLSSPCLVLTVSWWEGPSASPRKILSKQPSASFRRHIFVLFLQGADRLPTPTAQPAFLPRLDQSSSTRSLRKEDAGQMWCLPSRNL